MQEEKNWRQTGNNDLLSELDALTSQRRECPSEEVDLRVRGGGSEEVAERVDGRRDADAFSTTEDVEDLGHWRFSDSVTDLKVERVSDDRKGEDESIRTDMTITTDESIPCSPRRERK